MRHVDGLTMRNIKLRIEHPDYRPAFVFDDVHNLRLQTIEIVGDKKKQSIVLHNTPHVKMDNDLGVLEK